MRKSLSTSLSSECCLFSDILEIWGQNPKVTNQVFMNCKSFDEKVLLARGLSRSTHGYCYTHGQACAFQSGAKVRVQGPPCPDFSSAGKRLGVDGPRLPAILAAGAKADAVASPALVVENVPGFPLQLAEAVYGPRFVWQGLMQEPSMVGFDMMCRTRCLSIMSRCA